MSPIKVMSLLLTGITPFVIASGVARSAEPQIILAQAQTKEQQEEERKRRQQHQEPQHQQQQPHGQPPHGAQDQQKRPEHNAQEQQQHQQQKQAEEQHEKALEQQRLKEHKPGPSGAPDSHHPQEQRLGQAPATPSGQGKLNEQQDAHRKALEEERLRNEQAKAHELQERQRHTEHELQQEKQKVGLQQQQAHHEQTNLRHELSAEEQKAMAGRDAHRADRDRLLEHQRQITANEHSQAAINERLRVQNERFRAISSQRHEIVDAGGHKIIQEPGNRTIFRVNNQAFIRHDESANFRLYGGNVQSQRAPNGNTISNIVRPDGSRIEVEVDIYGRPIRRVRFLPDGRRFVLFENRAIAAGIGIAALGALVIALPPLHADLPRGEYIVDAGGASEDDIYGALDAPPVEPLDRAYSLDEVLASVSLRERMRSISIDTINFEFGSSDVGPDQAVLLETVGAVIRRIANDNPGEVFLIEGHTDAVGSEEDNLSLSDRRAQAVADLLSQQFGAPRENLVTQGYGKQFLLIPTEEPERRNRRVVVRRLTPLLQAQPDRFSGGDGPPDEERR